MRLFLPLLLVFLFFEANSQTTISGKVSGNWTKDKSPYLVNGDINVLSTDSLIIGPGVKVIFQGHYKFDVAGKLLALGNKNDSVIFTVKDTLGFSNPAIISGSWNGINIAQETAKNVLFNCCVFEFGKGLGNDAGGAIDIKKLYGPVEILNSAFRNNKSIVGGAVSYYGLGSSANSLITIKNCSFKNNYAKTSGGAVRISSFNGLKELSNCTFINNKSGQWGGAMAIEAADKIYNCLFKNNSAATNGGAVWSGISTSLEIYNSIFDHNSAVIGAAYYANAGVYSGLYNCTLINNISTHSSVYTGTNTVIEFNIVNSIIWNPGTPEVILSAATTRKIVKNSIIRSATDSTWFSATCMDVDPLLTDYTPMEGSPCIDKGDNNYLDPEILVDFNNNCRVWDGKNTNSKIVDIGSIEYNSVDSLPQIKDHPNGTILCEGVPFTLNVSTVEEDKDYNYKWFFNNQLLSGSSSSFTINAATTGNSGYYFCRVNNQYGEIQSDIVNVVVNPLPIKPSKPFGTEDTITNFADSSVYEIDEIENLATIQWQLIPSGSGVLTFNDTMAVVKWNNTYEGNASLVVKHSNENCYSLSDTLLLIVERGLNYAQKPQLFKPKIYPNPTLGNFVIDFNGLATRNVDLIIIDFLGRIVREEPIPDNRSIVNYTLPFGVYHIILKSEGKLLLHNKIVVI